METLEEMRLLIGRNSGSVVANGETGSIAIVCMQSNLPLGRREVDGVGEEVGNDLCDAQGIGVAGRRLQIKIEAQAFRFHEWLELSRAITGKLGQVARLTVNLLGAGIEAGEVEQRLDQRLHPLGGLGAVGERLAVIGRALLTQKRALRVSENERYGRAEFVGGVRRKLFLPDKRGFESGKRVVENLGDITEFVPGLGELDAAGKITSGDLFCRATDFRQRARHARGDPPRQREAGQQHAGTDGRK